MVQQILDKQNKYQVYAERQKISENATGTLDISTDISQDEANSSLEYTPSQRKKKRTGTSLRLDVEILSQIGPVPYRLNMTSNQVVGITAALVNNSGGC